MARVKKGVNAHKRHKKILKLAKGFYGAKEQSIQSRESGSDEILKIRVCRQKVKEETVQTDVDRENQRGCENERYQLQQTDGRSQKVRYRNQQKDAFRKWRSTTRLHSQHFAKPRRRQQNKQPADKAKNKNVNIRTGHSRPFAYGFSHGDCAAKTLFKVLFCGKIKNEGAQFAREGGLQWLIRMNYFVW